MERIYNFALTAITQGRTVLVYHGVTARTAKHVKTADRLALVGGVMYVDGVSAKGMTVALKPEGGGIMTLKDFANMCKENIRFRESFSMHGKSVIVYLEVFDGEKWEDIDSIRIDIPDGD